MPAVFPTLPAFSTSNFFDHFPTIDATRWGSVTSGTGSQSATDSYAELLSPASSASFLYRAVQLDKTKSQLWMICASFERLSGSGGLDTAISLVNGASAPAADSTANITAKTLLTTGFGGGLQPTQFHPWYYTSAGVQTYYNNATDVWSSSYPGNANLAIPYVRYDSYYIVGIEIDGINNQWRSLYWAQAYDTTGTYTFNQGWRLFAVTPWVTWANTRSNSNVWLTIGQLTNDAAGSWRTRVEWVRYAEARAGNKVIDGWVAAKQALANAHNIRHVYSYDGVTFVPQDRTGWALTLGAGSPDNAEIQEPCVVFDGASTDWMFYTGTTGTTKSICVASVAHVDAGTGQNGTFTRYGSNPILSLGASGDFDDQQVGFAHVVCDTSDADSNKRWKMLYMGQKASDGKRRVGYATAAAPTGPWTKQGLVLDVGGSGANDEKQVASAVAVYVSGTWEVWYEGHDTSDVCHLMRATGTSFASLTKDGTTYYTPPTTATDQALTANLTADPGRTVTVGSTTGFTVDASVVLSQDGTLDNFSTSKVRKVVSGTQLELYHGLTGFTTTAPARIKQIDSGISFSPRTIAWAAGTSEWWFILTIWEPFSNATETAGYGVLLEEQYLFKHSASTPAGGTPAVDHVSSPITSRGNNSDQRSFENMALLSQPFGAADIGGTGGSGMTEADVVAGGKTITITLTGQTWIPS